MSLIERYIHQVVTRLPQSQQAEVAAEVRATIQDMAADHAKSENFTDADITAVLVKLGDPRLLAQQYSNTGNYLIGPVWFPIYKRILTTVLCIVLPIIACISIIVAIAENSTNIMAVFLTALGAAWTTGLHIVFWTTITFAFMERQECDPEVNCQPKHAATPWSPDQLPAIPTKRKITLAEGIAGTVVTTLGLLYLLSFPLGIAAPGADQARAFLHPDIFTLWMPAFIVLAGLGLAHEIQKLRAGNWTAPVMATNIILNTASAALLLTLVLTDSLINPDFLAGLVPELSINGAEATVGLVVNIVAACIVAGMAWSIAQAIWFYRKYRHQQSLEQPQV